MEVVHIWKATKMHRRLLLCEASCWAKRWRPPWHVGKETGWASICHPWPMPRAALPTNNGVKAKWVTNVTFADDMLLAG